MFESWGRLVYARRRLVLALAGLVVVAAAVWGTGVFGALQSGGGFTAPGSQSQRESDLAARTFGRNTADVVVLYTSRTLTVHDAAFRNAVTRTLAALPRTEVPTAASYWTTGSAQFVGDNGHATYVALQLAGGSDSARLDTYAEHPGQAGRPRADQPGRRAGADLLGDQQGGQGGHRPGRGHLPAGAAGPAAGDLRQPGRGQPAAGHRRHRHPRLVRRAAAAHPGHRGVHLLDQHHHDPGPGPGHRLRPVHGQPVPRGTAPAAQRRRTRWPARWPPRAAPSRCPGSPWPWRWPG